ncbi:MAG: hypothetical protein ACRD16_14410, partial [Thermoanaerobaculia bacterium]
MPIDRKIRRHSLLVLLLLSALAGLAGSRASAATKTFVAPLRAGAQAELPTETASDGRRAYIVVLRDPPLARSVSTSLLGAPKPLRSAAPAELEAKATQLGLA